MLTIANLTYRIAGRLIFEDASALVQEGWKVGLVGANGTGKSTLFKLIARELHMDGGDIHLSDRHTLGMVRQDIPADDTPLIDIVLAADVERTKLMKAAETEQNGEKLADIYTRLGDIDAYAAPARASSILSGLGFKEEELTHPIKSFSGGWRMRVALAAALFQQPDFLLLDEPTNHLDLEAVMWLEAYLATYPKTLMLISHDRELLNKCVDHIIHVDNKALTAYTGTYDTFERERAERLMNQQKLHEKQSAQRAHMQAFVDRFKAKASKARQAQSRMKALEKMSVVDAVMASRSIKFNFGKPEDMPPPLLAIDHADVGYVAGKPILTDVHERIDMDDRIALLGANGNGKSTLIKLLAGRLDPMKGELIKSGKLRIGYFSQHQAEEMDMSSSPFMEMSRAMPGKKEAEVRARLGIFGFNKALSDGQISTLSGGEKARLLFAIMGVDSPHMLLLDEPTNHLDMDAREALVQALNNFNGAVVIVSHDPSMVERVVDRLWLVHNGTCADFDGDLDAYRGHVLEQRREERRAGKAEKTGGPNKKELQKALNDKKKRWPDLYKAMGIAENAYAKQNKMKKSMEADMAAPDTYENEDKLRGLQIDYARIVAELEELEDVWMKAMAAFEAAE
ncbi:MAG: glycosyl transferase family 1 [Alphaproteobacteria bacterium CG_4_10_14_0_8_um_filter_53_9]|nr:MAG: glycosyl transferase family 1 [Alphaproteobacteria bacterium CG_4_10_14_0_8_um_filter_53_9]